MDEFIDNLLELWAEYKDSQGWWDKDNWTMGAFMEWLRQQRKRR